jgi:hypothetical protein
MTDMQQVGSFTLQQFPSKISHVAVKRFGAEMAWTASVGKGNHREILIVIGVDLNAVRQKALW